MSRPFIKNIRSFFSAPNVPRAHPHFHEYTGDHTHGCGTFASVFPSCRTCNHFMPVLQNSDHKMGICARFYMNANICRMDEKKCGISARFWAPVKNFD